MPRRPPAAPAVSVRPLSKIRPRDVAWLWPGRLALGKLAILDGDPGLGKSLLTLDLCARLSTGRPFPGADVAPAPAGAVILNGEDGAADTIRPRLESLGADLDRVFILHYPAAALRFPSRTAELRAAAASAGARLVVIDPVMAFLDPAVNPGSDPSVRAALRPLARLAADLDCAVLLVRHLTKIGGFRSLYRGGGSIGFVGACRIAWLVAREPYEPHVRVLAQVKNNLAAPQPSLAFTVEPGPTGALSLAWLGERPWTADQLLAAARKPPDDLPALERARRFLQHVLRDGPRHSRDIADLARGKHLARATLRRARIDLHARTQLVTRDGRRYSYLLLPGQKLPPDAGTPAPAGVLEEYLAPLRERFPPDCPLDEP